MLNDVYVIEVWK